MSLDHIDRHKGDTVLCVAFCVAFAFSAMAYGEPAVRKHITSALHVCESAPQNGGTLDQAICYGDEDARQDQILNNKWRKLIVQIPITRREALRANERRWITKRDAECHREAADYINSTAAYMYNVCFAEQTIHRTIWLESLRRGRTPSS